jgi:hypothetical protein
MAFVFMSNLTLLACETMEVLLEQMRSKYVMGILCC